jgi:hypothetical protein
MTDRNNLTKDDLANHVRIYTGRLFYDGSYTDEQRWVKAEAFEALRSRLAAEPPADYRAIVARLLKDADNSDYTVGSCEDLAWQAARDALNREAKP